MWPTAGIPSWRPAQSAPGLGEHEIHLWCAAVGDFRSDLRRLELTLSRDERLRAAQFRSVTDREAFIVRRGILRRLLGQYLDREATAIAFAYGRFGKPAVAAAPNDRRLYFNLSRSGPLVLYAVSRAGPVGVDVERLRPMPDFPQIVSQFFSPLEASRVLTQPPDRQMDAFFAAWTRTEALTKATGDGIGRGSSRMSADCEDESRLNDRWHFEELRPAAGYVSTLAHNIGGARLRHLQVGVSAQSREGPQEQLIR